MYRLNFCRKASRFASKSLLGGIPRVFPFLWMPLALGQPANEYTGRTGLGNLNIPKLFKTCAGLERELEANFKMAILYSRRIVIRLLVNNLSQIMNAGSKRSRLDRQSLPLLGQQQQNNKRRTAVILYMFPFVSVLYRAFLTHPLPSGQIIFSKAA
ncbi:hypothetical protein QBC32DRAFT_130823 [Pseudoneurospora amorphoporcata]|uniref:Uncharacterized protein n=1 Tax=Pseudoneurospora amorphoporcata TaxID=241081 RepID=A0AAN6NXJ8_9PEZI|nr:hypothetical protein QBC32DRAFT_130823 [Pseudoneurospora amorphoporcata]